MLKDVPDGVTCFIDANIFAYHIVDSPPLSEDCSDFLKRVEQGRVAGVTSAVAVAEATHKVMLAEALALHGLDPRGLVARLKRKPELLAGLTEHKKVAVTVRLLNVPVEPITLELLTRGAELSVQQRLLTNDALTMAAMEKLSVTHLATNDDDFDAVPGIAVFKPARS
jgi:predicted nucleic acid-binding protein